MYEDYEGSVEGGSPVELYELRVGTDVFRLCSGADTYVADALSYEPATISRGQIQAGPDARLQTMSLVVPSASEFARRFVGVPPPGEVSCRIRRVHRDDPDQEVRQIFHARVSTVAIDNDGATALIVLLPPTGELAKMLGRYKFSGMCQHVLYDSGCKVVRASFTFSGLAGTTADPSVITVDGLDAAKGVGWALGGIVTLASGDARAVYRHTATNTLRLLIPFREDVAGQTVEVVAGCDHNYTGDCTDKFDNRVNFGGCHWIPKKNIHITGVD